MHCFPSIYEAMILAYRDTRVFLRMDPLSFDLLLTPIITEYQEYQVKFEKSRLPEERLALTLRCWATGTYLYLHFYPSNYDFALFCN